jgi:hypothetical protein
VTKLYLAVFAALLLALSAVAGATAAGGKVPERLTRYMPLRPSTWGTVRTNVLMSPHRDQLAP